MACLAVPPACLTGRVAKMPKPCLPVPPAREFLALWAINLSLSAPSNRMWTKVTPARRGCCPTSGRGKKDTSPRGVEHRTPNIVGLRCLRSSQRRRSALFRSAAFLAGLETSRIGDITDWGRHLEHGPLNIAFASSEVVPFAKTGGLADVVEALPRELEKLGHHPVVFVPAYRQTRDCGLPIEPTDIEVSVQSGAEGGAGPSAAQPLAEVRRCRSTSCNRMAISIARNCIARTAATTRTIANVSRSSAAPSCSR